MRSNGFFRRFLGWSDDDMQGADGDSGETASEEAVLREYEADTQRVEQRERGSGLATPEMRAED